MPLTLKGTLKPGEPDRRYYMIRVQVDGRREVLSSGTRDRKLAERREQEVVDAIRKNPDVTKDELTATVRGEQSVRHRTVLRQSNELALEEAIARCFADETVWGRIKATVTHTINTNHLVEFFGADRPLKSIDRDAIQEYVKSRLKAENAPSTINRQLSCLGRVFRAALEWKDGLKTIPKITYLKEKGGRKFYLTPEQEKEVFTQVLALDEARPGPQGGPPRRKDAFRYLLLFKVLIESGMRLGEALRLRHDDLVFDAPKYPGLIRLWRTEELKNGKARTVPMTTLCRETLLQCRHLPRGPFSDLRKRRAQDVWSRAVAAAKISNPECVIHSLRHTCATRLLQSVRDVKLVQEWLGHTTVTTTSGIYAHVTESYLGDAAKALDNLRGT